MEKRNPIVELLAGISALLITVITVRQLKVAKSAVYDTIKRYKELGNNTRPSQNWSTKNGAYSKEN